MVSWDALIGSRIRENIPTDLSVGVPLSGATPGTENLQES